MSKHRRRRSSRYSKRSEPRPKPVRFGTYEEALGAVKQTKGRITVIERVRGGLRIQYVIPKVGPRTVRVEFPA